MRRLAVIAMLLLCLAACDARREPTAAERQLAATIAERSPQVFGVVATSPAAAATAQRLFAAVTALAPINRAQLLTPRQATLAATLEFVADIDEFDLLVVVAPADADPWPELDEKQKRRFRAEKADCEEDLFHIREEFLHWRTFYKPPQRHELDDNVAAVYQLNKAELERLRAGQTGRGPQYFGDILRAAVAQTRAPETPEATREVLARLLRVPGSPAALSVWEGPVRRREAWREQELVFVSAVHGTVAATLLLPNNADAPAPGVLALHGHSDLPEDYLRRFGGQTLATRGALVLAPAFPGSGKDSLDERTLAATAIAAGANLMALRVALARELLDYLASRPDVDRARLGVMGHSMGGALALLVGAADPRTQAVASDTDTPLLRSLTDDNPAVSVYMPGILDLGDWGNVAALVAPRALLRSPYGFPDKPGLVEFMDRALAAPQPVAPPSPAVTRLKRRPDTARTLATVLADMAATTKRPDLAVALGWPTLLRLSDPVELRDDVCRVGELGDVRFAIHRPTQSPNAWLAYVTTNAAAGERRAVALAAQGVATVVFDPTVGRNDVEDSFKLLAAGFTEAGLWGVKMDACRAHLADAGRLPKATLPVLTSEDLADVLLPAVGALDRFGPLLVPDRPASAVRYPPIPDYAGALRGWSKIGVPPWVRKLPSLDAADIAAALKDSSYK